MRAIVVYESMFGGTRHIAEAVADGLRSSGSADVRLVRAADADEGALDGMDLVVVGGPTHAWSMPRPSTRRGAPDYVRKPGSGLTLEPGAETGPGVREWLSTLHGLRVAAAAFDTRIAMTPLLTGRASRAIARALRRAGAAPVAPPESFLVDKKSHLLPGEVERARAWGAQVAATFYRIVARAG